MHCLLTRNVLVDLCVCVCQVCTLTVHSSPLNAMDTRCLKSIRAVCCLRPDANRPPGDRGVCRGLEIACSARMCGDGGVPTGDAGGSTSVSPLLYSTPCAACPTCPAWVCPMAGAAAPCALLAVKVWLLLSATVLEWTGEQARECTSVVGSVLSVCGGVLCGDVISLVGVSVALW